MFHLRKLVSAAVFFVVISLGMLKHRTFHVVRVSSNHGAGISAPQAPDAVLEYTGNAVKVRLNGP